MSALTDAVARRSVWITLIVLATVVGSLAFSCATPFAALAALAALHMDRRDAFIFIGASWLANQAVGFAFLDYPLTWDCLVGGMAIGAGAVLATGAASGVEMAAGSHRGVLTLLASFVAAFASYQIVVHAIMAMQSSAPCEVSPEALMYVLKVNVVAFLGLLLLQRAGSRLGLVPSGRAGGLAATTP